MEDPELKAMAEITKLLEGLNEDQRRNVLAYVGSRYWPSLAARKRGPGRSTTEERETEEFEDIGSLFDAAAPQTEADRVLVVAYWHQVVEGTESFEAFPVSKGLKHLGHPVSNITRALESLINHTPRLILQIGKSGKAKQSRKRYKVTREGIKAVQEMLDRSTGGDNGN